MFSYFAKILKSLKYQSVLKVYYLTKNRQKRAKSPNIRKLQIADYQYNIFFWFLLFSRHYTGSGYKGKAERMIIHCLAFPFLLTSSSNQIDAYFVELLSLKWERCWVISMYLVGCFHGFWLKNCKEVGFIIIWSWRRWNCFQNRLLTDCAKEIQGLWHRLKSSAK